MTKAELVKEINRLAALNELKTVTTRPKKSILETVLDEYQDIELDRVMANAKVEPMEPPTASGIDNIGGGWVVAPDEPITVQTKEESDKEADSLFNWGLVVVGMCIVFVVVTILAFA